MTRRVRLGVDTGGTFTDVVAVDEDTGELAVTKTPSTPSDPAEGFMTGVHRVLDTLGLGGDAVTAVSHGTTVATNRLLEGRVENLGFVTNDGYEFLLEIARQSVPDGYGNSYFWVKPDRIVPVDRVRTVRGRMAADGSEIDPFDLEQAAEQARWFRDRGIDTIGVCFLHSYVDDSHERAMRDVLAHEHPKAVVSISSEVLREYREYERAVTTLVDAAVKPDIRRYVATIAHRLAELAGLDRLPPRHEAGRTDGRAATVDGPGGRRSEATTDGFGAALPSGSPAGRFGAVPFYVMKSNGGVLSATEVVAQPITTVLSGPAAGALGAAVVAAAAGFSQVVTLDGGGTSTDVAVVVDGQPALTTEGTIGVFPCKVPMIDVVTVGAGGGSIAWLSPEGTLKVGPRSAGADPGPVCYGLGGVQPTVTDAHVVLGRIPPHLLGGEVPLDVASAAGAIDALASELGLSREACAAGVLEVSAWNQANALRQVTVQRGLDVRDFTMVTFGGSGSLLACRLVDVLGLDGVLVPVNPGNLSAYGLLTVDVRNDYVQTAVARASTLDPAGVQAGYDALTQRAAEALAREGFPPEQRVFERTADLRYFGQAYEVRVAVPAGAVTEDLLAAVSDAFHDEHRVLYGYDNRADARQEVEWVNLRVSGIGPLRTPSVPEVAVGGGARSACTGRRKVFFDDWVDADLFDREHLGAGDEIVGPAVVEEFSSTLPLHPGFTARVDAFGNLVVRRTAS